jgi:hypothetical protein
MAPAIWGGLPFCGVVSRVNPSARVDFPERNGTFPSVNRPRLVPAPRPKLNGNRNPPAGRIDARKPSLSFVAMTTAQSLSDSLISASVASRSIALALTVATSSTVPISKCVSLSDGRTSERLV